MAIFVRRHATLACIAALVATALFTAGCSSNAAEQTPPPAAGRGPGAPGAQGPVPVTVATAAQEDVPLDIQVIGTVEPILTVQVHSQITGGLTSVNFKEGDDVTKGQVLFTLDKRPLEAALAQ